MDVTPINSDWSFRDYLGAVRMRLGVRRNSYKIKTGLYELGNPDRSSPVLVTSNYKLTFDALRKELDGIDCWILVVDTKGINVWCAGGKGTFSAEEIVSKVISTKLSEIVEHRKLILPQLSANGVAIRKLKALCDFSGTFGPIRASDIRTFLENDMETTPEMRLVTFSLWERFVLTPLELFSVGKHLIWIAALAFIISGLGQGSFFSPSEGLSRGIIIFSAFITGLISGAVATPLALQYVPGRSFALKGVSLGLVLSFIHGFIFFERLTSVEIISTILLITATSSFFATAFTGSTPFTSPSGVEKEMKKWLPVQAIGIIISIALWIYAGFSGGY